MKKRVGRIKKTAVCMLCAILLGGCWNSHELDTLGIVMALGIDKAEGGGAVRITAQMVKPGEIGAADKNGGGGDAAKAFWNATDTGDTVFGTIRALTNQSSRKLFFPHNQVIILGSSLAEEGIRNYIDVFMRDPEARISVFLLISQDTAEGVLNVDPGLEKVPAQNIVKLIEGQGVATSQVVPSTLREFAVRLMSKTSAPVVAMIEVFHEGDRETLRISGTAVFKEDRLVGTLDRIEGRGLLWVLDEVKSGIVEVRDEENAPIALEIVRASGKVTPELREGRVIMKVEVREEGSIGEYGGARDLTELSVISDLERKKAEAIRGEIMAAVEKAKDLNADIFGFGDVLYQRYPKQWKEMEDNWDEIFQEVEVEITVDAKLRLTGRISNPISPQ